MGLKLFSNPFLLNSFRNGARSQLTLIVAETIASDSGIGYLAMNAREFLQTDVVVFAILLYALLGKLADVAARFLESILLQWHPSYASA
ncbi:MAG: hypothetical protein M1G31_03440 [Pseudanabaena sp. Salubria-1]|nr:hypothetical protein [Pseudanabaena sp. Salubria-1]